MQTSRAASAPRPDLATPGSDDAPPRPRRWFRWPLAILVGLLALGALTAVVVALVARGVVADRLTAMGAERGLELSWGAIDLPLLRGATVRDLRVASAVDGRVLATIREVETDVSLLGAIGGRRRPEAVTLRGVDAHVAVVAGRLVGFDSLFGGERDPAAPSGGPARPLRVVIDGGSAVLDVDALGVAVERVRLDGLSGTLARDAERRLSFTGAADVVVGDRASHGTLTLDADGVVALTLDGGLQIGAVTSRGPLWLALRGARRDPGQGRTELLGIGASHGDDRATATRIVVTDHGSGLVPAPRDLDGVSIEDAAVEHDGTRLVAGRAEIRFGAPDADGLPVPREIRARDLGVETRHRTVKGTFDEATLTLVDPIGALRAGRPLDALQAITLARPRLTATVGEGGDDLGGDTSSLIARVLGNGDGPAADAADAPAPAPPTEGAPATSGRLARLLTRLRAWQLAVEDGTIDVHAQDGTPLLVLEDFGLTTREVGEGLLELGVRAAVERRGEETGKVDAAAGFDETGALVYANGSISGKDLAHQVARFASHVEVQPDAFVDIGFHYQRPIDPEAPHRITGRAKLSHFTFQYWRVADAEVKDLEAEVAFDLAVYKKDRRAVLALSSIAFGEAKLEASLDVTLPRGGRPRFAARLEMPTQDCGAVARSIPRALIPRLSSLSAHGRAWFKAELTLDMADPYGLELSVKGDLNACDVTSLGPGVNLRALQGNFVHVPLEPERGRLVNIRVGRGTREWIASKDLPELVKATAWITEDRRYFDHGGVRWDLIERALKMDLEHERFVYGGSTVTQQLVKNLYLDRGKSLSRKLEEAIIAWQMERVLDKDEILTIYVNVIEYGPDIYGVKHAARFYFGKRVDELDALEVAFIMGLKPYPAQGYKQWLAGSLKPWWVRRLKHVLGMVVARSEVVTAEQIAAFEAIDFQPHFRRPDGSEVPAARPTTPEPSPEDDGGGEAWDPWR
ncbi:MAG: hypothetical protein CVU56_04460 [Deltaproteobacteria bacterium HGW-Deltaproteobacteria-14]|nr:MAG: hypothetical protein CVU56_04460 [Deltaproteobacteria bacterium HGW-Deltaproteobacteria-14]